MLGVLALHDVKALEPMLHNGMLLQAIHVLWNARGALLNVFAAHGLMRLPQYSESFGPTQYPWVKACCA